MFLTEEMGSTSSADQQVKAGEEHTWVRFQGKVTFYYIHSHLVKCSLINKMNY